MLSAVAISSSASLSGLGVGVGFYLVPLGEAKGFLVWVLPPHGHDEERDNLHITPSFPAGCRPDAHRNNIWTNYLLHHIICPLATRDENEDKSVSLWLRSSGETLIYTPLAVSQPT